MVAEEDPELTSSDKHNKSTPTDRAISPEEELKAD